MVEFFPNQANIPKTSSADRATYVALKLVKALRNMEQAAPFATFGYAQLYLSHRLSELFHTAAPVCLIPTSSTPQVTITFPRVPIMSHQQEPTRTHPRLISPTVVHTIPPESIIPPRL